MPEPKEVIEPALDLMAGRELTGWAEGQLVRDPVFQHGSLWTIAQEPVLVPPGCERTVCLLVDEAGAVIRGVVDERPGDADRTYSNAQPLPMARLDPTDAVQDADIHPGRREPFEGTGLAVPAEDIGSWRCDLGSVRKCCLGHASCLAVRRPSFPLGCPGAT
jgi:hypothetical protein